MCVGVLLERILTHNDCFICGAACYQPASVCPFACVPICAPMALVPLGSAYLASNSTPKPEAVCWHACPLRIGVCARACTGEPGAC